MRFEQQTQEVVYHFEMDLTRTEVEELLKGSPDAFKKFIKELSRARAAFKPEPTYRDVSPIAKVLSEPYRDRTASH